jgi:hypothetical protein
MAVMLANAKLEIEFGPQIPFAFVSWCQPIPWCDPNDPPGNIPCDCHRIVAKSANSEIVFDRRDKETLAAFQERTAEGIPRDGEFWLALPEPIVLGIGDQIPTPSTKISMLSFPVAFVALFTAGTRYKVFYGGRGGGKSVSFARALALLALLKPTKIACCREFQNSIADSVHAVIREAIEEMGYAEYFEVTREKIVCLPTKSSFIFKGLKGPDALRSAQGIDFTWVEEGQIISQISWETLLPTVMREAAPEVWISFNPINETDPTYQEFITKTPGKMIRAKVDWKDNPFFPSALNELRLEMLANSPDSYEHIWDGSCFTLSNGRRIRGASQSFAGENLFRRGLRIRRRSFDVVAHVDYEGWKERAPLDFPRGLPFPPRKRRTRGHVPNGAR